jgi:transcriptional regulator PpsR
VKALKKSLGSLDADAVTRLVTAATDIALVVDGQGVVRDLAVGNDELSREARFSSWIGKPWIETVTIESRPKVEELIRDASAKTAPRWRQVNHPSTQGGADLPVRYSALNMGANGRILAVGRELRSMSVLQQRLVDAQQSMEREYSRLRFAETRYRQLFQMASEAVIIAEAQTLKIIEANPVAVQLLGKDAKRIIGRQLYDFVDPKSLAAARALAQSIRATGRPEQARVQFIGHKSSKPGVLVSASLFRQEHAAHLLIRLIPDSAGAADSGAKAMATLQRVVENMPDGFVVVGHDQRILTVNSAFLELAQLASAEQARGEPLDRWLGRSAVDLNVLRSNLSEHGTVRHFSTIMRGEYGAAEDVEVSAVSVVEGEQPCIGLTIRSVGRRLASDSFAGRELPKSVKQLTGLVGQVPLKNLVRETTDLIERLCIEAALELVRDNRASAAEMLGLSRQSLYVKLRRYGLGESTSDE